MLYIYGFPPVMKESTLIPVYDVYTLIIEQPWDTYQESPFTKYFKNCHGGKVCHCGIREYRNTCTPILTK